MIACMMSYTSAWNVTEAPVAREVRAVLAKHHVVESALLDSIRALPPDEAARLARELRACACRGIDSNASIGRAPAGEGLAPVSLAMNATCQARPSAVVTRRQWTERLRQLFAESAWGIATVLCTAYVTWYASFS